MRKSPKGNEDAIVWAQESLQSDGGGGQEEEEGARVRARGGIGRRREGESKVAGSKQAWRSKRQAEKNEKRAMKGVRKDKAVETRRLIPRDKLHAESGHQSALRVGQ